MDTTRFYHLLQATQLEMHCREDQRLLIINWSVLDMAGAKCEIDTLNSPAKARTIAMKRQNDSARNPKLSDFERALAALNAEDLRDLIRAVIPRLDNRAFSWLTNAIIGRASSGRAEWQPSGPADEVVAEVLAFAEAAKRTGYADPSKIDQYLQEGKNAFLARDYRAAIRIFQALLLPLSEGEIDLGQDEMFEEVLGVDTADCAAQCAVAVYMTSAPDQRAGAVFAAMEYMREVGVFLKPLQEMESVAVEPLPDFEVFLPQWRALMEDTVKGERGHEWDMDADYWRREVTLRLEGADGLARIAKSTRRSDDLQAWCRALIDGGDWEAALSANEESAEIAADKTYSQGDFLDGAALAARELGRKDLPKRLERAWRKAPSLLRLRRWLGSSRSKSALKRRAAAAIEGCPVKAHRQKAFLHVLLGDYESAAKLLASAPGLGWSDIEHAGHLLFPIFCRLLGNGLRYLEREARHLDIHVMDMDEMKSLSSDRDEPCLPNPSVDEIMALAGLDDVKSDHERAGMIRAMKTAARKRIEGVTEHKRRRYYGHAASLVAACAAVDKSSGMSEWIAAIRSKYRRFPALQREFDRHLI
jgi:hypothetical protein